MYFLSTMRLIDRLISYLNQRGITAYAFERACGVGNGYLGKQAKGKGTMGSDILEKISEVYPDLRLDWLITGKGKMLQRVKSLDTENASTFEMQEDAAIYKVRKELIGVLKEQLQVLEASSPGKKPVRKKSKKSDS